MGSKGATVPMGFLLDFGEAAWNRMPKRPKFARKILNVSEGARGEVF